MSKSFQKQILLRKYEDMRSIETFNAEEFAKRISNFVRNKKPEIHGCHINTSRYFIGNIRKNLEPNGATSRIEMMRPFVIDYDPSDAFSDEDSPDEFEEPEYALSDNERNEVAAALCSDIKRYFPLMSSVQEKKENALWLAFYLGASSKKARIKWNLQG